MKNDAKTRKLTAKDDAKTQKVCRWTEAKCTYPPAEVHLASAQLHHIVETYSVGASDDEIESCKPTSPDEVWWSEVEEQIVLEEIFNRDPIKRPGVSCEARPTKVRRPG